jgi:hypothetical protein
MTERSEQLISLFLQDSSAMTEEQAHELSKWISQDDGNTKEFIEASLFYRCIHDALLSSDEERNNILRDDVNNPETNVESFFNRQFWDMLLKEEATAPRVEVENAAIPEVELIQKVKREKTVRKINKTTLLTFVISAAAMISMIIYVMLVPNTPNVEVATLADTLNAQWAESSAPTMGKNIRLMTNHTLLMLRKGYAEIVFDNNSKVVIEGPAEFQVLSYDQIKLNYGRLYATVPNESLGFIVSTPNSKIIDLGTEFGVQADISGTTELHVVKGKTSLISGPEDNKYNVLVTAGSAKRVTSNLPESVDIACNNKMFVRQFDSQRQFVWRGQKQMSLADIVGGGSGFGGGVLNTGIDLSSGSIVAALQNDGTFPGPSGYRSVAGNSCIDGVFVPGIIDGKTQIVSDGSLAVQFPKTSGLVWGYIFNGATHQGTTTPWHSLQLNGTVCGTPDNPAITIHSNQGVTFDLSKIRESIPGLTINAFHSLVGVSETVQSALQNEQNDAALNIPEIKKVFDAQRSKVEFWVFVDGRQVFHKELSSADEAESLQIPITAGDRFLTLAVTESDDGDSYDWALFARPELILESTQR